MPANRIIELLRAVWSNPLRETLLAIPAAQPPAAGESGKEIDGSVKALLDAIERVEAPIISPAFKLVFLSAMGLTVASFLGAVFVAFLVRDPLTMNQQTVFDTLNTVWKMGVGAIFGLLTAKATD